MANPAYPHLLYSPSPYPPANGYPNPSSQSTFQIPYAHHQESRSLPRPFLPTTSIAGSGGHALPAGSSTPTYPALQYHSQPHSLPKPPVEAIPPPTPKVSYEPPVFRTFQERKRAKDMALRVGLPPSTDPYGIQRASSSLSLQSVRPSILQQELKQNTSNVLAAARSATLPNIPRPLPSPSSRTPSPLLPSAQTSSPPSSPASMYSTAHNPMQATIERSDTLSSVKSLDRMGFSSPGRRPLPKPPVGVNSSKSLDRGIPTTMVGLGLRRKQPSVVSEEGSEDCTMEEMIAMEVAPSVVEARSSSRAPTTPHDIDKHPTTLPSSLPTFHFPDSDSNHEEESSSIPVTPPDRAPSPGIAFSGLPVIQVSSEDTGEGKTDVSIPIIAPPGAKQPSVVKQIRSAGAIVCTGCDQPIIGRIVNAMGQRWHPQCFKCDACGGLLEHVSSYEHEGRAYCHLDYHDTPIVDARFVTLEDEMLGQRYYHELHFFCSECGDPFLDPSQSSAPGTERTRGDDDETNAFVIHKGHPYCERCHLRLHKPKCKACAKPIPDIALNAMGARWHRECFVCANCHYEFANNLFFPKDGKAFCTSCYEDMIYTPTHGRSRNELEGSVGPGMPGRPFLPLQPLLAFRMLLTLLLLLPFTLAKLTGSNGLTSLIARWNDPDFTLSPELQGCSTSNFQLDLPTGLSVPSNQSVSLVTVGRGIQNYTCTNGTYVSNGALANLYDVSCLFDAVDRYISSGNFSTLIPEIAYDSLSYPDTTGLPVAVHHLFIDTPGSTTIGAISPEFVGSTDKVVTAKTASVNATDSAVDIPWLQLTAIPGQGTLAKSVFRIDTVKGQPPKNCSTQGERLSIQYAAMYVFTQ
ncbi:MAG: hypothetical protein TREMPRED_003133 [Tremellales sp. Tagirdzhanova-0007]|nr:MAG: hypothetical protein TREMPRED_003133 [Tremellales sp. Tagirdzhanova-0007]